MKRSSICILLVTCSLVVGCDVQSGITKKSVEKFEPTPTPTPIKTGEVVEQIDPADIVTVDATLDGPKININPSDDKVAVDCTKYNRVAINGDGKEIKIKGACKQLMLNGDRNKIDATALTEVVFNGSENAVKYSKYANGKKPLFKDNGSGNTLEKGVPANVK